MREKTDLEALDEMREKTESPTYSDLLTYSRQIINEIGLFRIIFLLGVIAGKLPAASIYLLLVWLFVRETHSRGSNSAR